MSRYIDADVLRGLMNDRYIEAKLRVPDNLAEGFVQMEKLINEQPTAFNLDKVVKELEDYSMWKEFMIFDLTFREREIIKKAIEIVKRGGIK